MVQKCRRRFSVSKIMGNMQFGADQDKQQANSTKEDYSQELGSLEDNSAAQIQPTEDRTTRDSPNDALDRDDRDNEEDNNKPATYELTQNQYQGQNEYRNSQFQEHKNEANIDGTPDLWVIPRDKIAFSAEFLENEELAQLIQEFVAKIRDDRADISALKAELNNDSDLDTEPIHPSLDRDHGRDAWQGPDGPHPAVGSRREAMIADYYTLAERLIENEDRLRILAPIYQQRNGRDLLRSCRFTFESDHTRSLEHEEDISKHLYDDDDENYYAEEDRIESSDSSVEEQQAHEDVHLENATTHSPSTGAEAKLLQTTSSTSALPAAPLVNPYAATVEDADEAVEVLNNLTIDQSIRVEIRRDAAREESSASTRNAASETSGPVINDTAKVDQIEDGASKTKSGDSASDSSHSTGNAGWFPIISASIEPASPYAFQTPEIRIFEPNDDDDDDDDVVAVSTRNISSSKGKTLVRKFE